MPVIVFGLNHASAPLDLLEQLTFNGDELSDALTRAFELPHVAEIAILATCNRVEIYAACDEGAHGLERFLSESRGIPADSFAGRTYTHEGSAVAEHLFSVASGIDSMMIGEPQIFTQVRRALRAAENAGTAGTELSALFREAIRVGRRARTETDIERKAASFVNVSIARARAIIGSLAGQTVLIVGAGTMGELAASALAAEGANVLVANRTGARARALADRYGGRCVDIDMLEESIANSRIMFCSTASPQPIVRARTIAAAMHDRAQDPLVIIDLAVPRDVERGATSIAGVTVFDIDAIKEAASAETRRSDIDAVRAIVSSEADRYANSIPAPALRRLYAGKDG